MSTFCRLLILAAMSVSLLSACSNEEASIEKAATEAKEAAGDAVKATEEAAAATKEQIKETTDEAEKAVENK